MSKRQAHTAADIEAEYERLSGWALVALQGAARRSLPDWEFEDVKRSRTNMIEALMEKRFGTGWEGAFR